MIAVTEETGLATTLNWPKDTVSEKPDKLGASFSYLRNDYSLPGISITVVGPNNEALYFRDFELNNEFFEDSLFMKFSKKKIKNSYFR